MIIGLLRQIDFARKRGAISLGLEVMVLIIIALALLGVLLFLLKSGIISPLLGVTKTTNGTIPNGTIP